MGVTLAPDDLGPTVCVGEILVEIVSTERGEGFREAQALVGPYPSGAPAIFVDQCARLGGSAAVIGAVGNDDFGHLCVERLRRDGVDMSAVAVDGDRPTGSAFVRYRPDGERDFVFNIAHSAAARIAWSPAAAALVGRAGHLHVMGSALSMPSAREVIGRSVDVVKARGGSVSLDPNQRKELDGGVEARVLLERILDVADLLLPSGGELQTAAGMVGDDGAGSEGTAVERLLARGIGEVVLKRGARGATAFERDGHRTDAAAYRVREVDPTGAGDCFGGAYVACRRLGLGVREALDYACAAGARNVTARGPMEGAGTRAELDAFRARTARA